MASLAFQILLLFSFWVALSGLLDAFHLTVGLLSALFFTILNRETKTNSKSKPIGFIRIFQICVGTLIYSLWLIKAIFLAAIHVSKLVLSPKDQFKPMFIEHKTKLKGEVAKTLFSNSITLTPGTITADIQGDQMTIHRIDPSSSEDIASGEMEKRINKIFGGAK